jgi:4-hydroxy-3-polyprenylbenzoate decarboxylase
MTIVVGITGATGAIFGIRTLQALRGLDVKTEVILSKWARVTIQHETELTASEVEGLATVIHSNNNLAASISSGSFKTDGMIIAPCSMKSLAAIRSGYAADLIGRAADVVLKERRKLVLLPRESPLNDIHLENMLALSRMGAVMIPPVPSFYNHPKSLGDMVDHIVARVLDQFGLETPSAARWQGLRESDPVGKRLKTA